MLYECKSPGDLLKTIEDNNIEMIDLRFTDVPGLWQHFSASLLLSKHRRKQSIKLLNTAVTRLRQETPSSTVLFWGDLAPGEGASLNDADEKRSAPGGRMRALTMRQ